MPFKPFEFAPRGGCFDDAVATDGDALDSYTLRELCRNANYYGARPHLLYRYVASGDNPDLVAPGASVGNGWPWWFTCVPGPPGGIVVPKKPGIKQVVVAVRSWLTNGRRMNFLLGTNRQPPTLGQTPSDFLTIVGAGASQRDLKIFPVQTEADEVLAFQMQGQLDPATDPLMNVGTFGGKNTGTLQEWLSRDTFFDLTTTWNNAGANQVHLGGHYITFTAISDGRVLLGQRAIVDVYRGQAAGGASSVGQGLRFWPPWPDSRVLPSPSNGIHYTIQTLPQYRLLSIACYGIARTF